jgi:hypothetical protein
MKNFMFNFLFPNFQKSKLKDFNESEIIDLTPQFN